MTTPAAPTIAVAPARKMDDYREALRVAGIAGHELVYEQDAPDAVVARHAGLLLLGGGDVDPALYGEERHPTTEVVAAPRDEYEIALVKAALARNVPIFAICRGIQLLNVALGGTLVQDLPTERPSDVEHAPKDARGKRTHDVMVVPESRLARAIGASGMRANSSHHQAVDRLASPLRATGTAPDGVIEGLETPDDAWWVLGVQWHPEELTETSEAWDRGLFAAFAEAVRGRSRGASATSRRTTGSAGLHRTP